MRLYVIENVPVWDYVDPDQRDTEYWSNSDGWVYLMSADVFTHDERCTLNLPDGGEWCELPKVLALADECGHNDETHTAAGTIVCNDCGRELKP